MRYAAATDRRTSCRHEGQLKTTCWPTTPTTPTLLTTTASGSCTLPGGAGRTRTGEPEYGPFPQLGTLNGVPIVVGGKGELVPVHLQSHDQVHNCLAKRELAKNIGMHLFTMPLRVSGVGRWFRDREGGWTMKSFRIHEYKQLRSESPAEATRRLQSIDAGWKERPDPLGDLVDLRKLEG